MEYQFGAHKLPHTTILGWFDSFNSSILPYYPIFQLETSHCICEKACLNNLLPEEDRLVSLVLSLGIIICDPHIGSRFCEHDVFSWGVESAFELLSSQPRTFMDIQSLFLAAILNILLLRSPLTYLHHANIMSVGPYHSIMVYG